MRTISHRELRNNSSSVLREVENGESFVITNRGEIVATLAPAGNDRELRCVRPAKRPAEFSAAGRRRITEPASVALDELRDDR